MSFDRIRRVNYLPTGAAASCLNGRGVDSDFQHFHLPTAQAHNRLLHGVGVAAGLEVVGAVGSSGVVVAAGVAIDRIGRTIALSDSGQATVGDSPESLTTAAVPVSLDTLGLAGKTLWVVIEFRETLVSPDATAAPCGMLEHQPWLHLVETGTDVGDAVVLGTVVVDATGLIASISPAGRQVVGLSSGEIHIRRSALDAGNVKVADQPAGTIRPLADGLQITVPRADDDVAFSADGGGKLREFRVNADSVTLDANVPAILRHRHYHGIVDIDENTPTAVQFYFESADHIPKVVKLAIRASRFSRAFYTEMGGHTHAAGASPVDLAHAHTHNINIVGDGAHSHPIRIGDTGGIQKPPNHNYDGQYDQGASLGSFHGGVSNGWWCLTSCATGNSGNHWVGTRGHWHTIAGGINANLGPHSHSISVLKNGSAVNATSDLKEYFADLKVVIDDTDQTAAVQTRAGMDTLGNTTAAHQIVTKGTGILDVTDLVAKVIGTHEVRFEVPAGAGGGKLHYDLFCE